MATHNAITITSLYILPIMPYLDSINYMMLEWNHALLQMRDDAGYSFHWCTDLHPTHIQLLVPAGWGVWAQQSITQPYASCLCMIPSKQSVHSNSAAGAWFTSVQSKPAGGGDREQHPTKKSKIQNPEQYIAQQI
jgi:hypothetical protein